MRVLLFIVGAIVVIALLVIFLVLIRRSSARQAAIGTAEIDKLVQEHIQERKHEEQAIQAEVQEHISDDSP